MISLNQLKKWRRENNRKVFSSRPVNNLHLHTPHSFSYFPSIAKAIKEAKKQDIKVLGISDFYTTEGYDEFTLLCNKQNIFPIYGMEVMSLDKQYQRKGLLYNDPQNPGRVYLCGKGFRYPVTPGKWETALLNRVKKASNQRMEEMINKLNLTLNRTCSGSGLALEKKKIPLWFSYDEISKSTPSGWVRERHLSQMLYEKINHLSNNSELFSILCGEEIKKENNNSAFIQNKLRENLLKAGKVAYVEEKHDAFLTLEEAKTLFLKFGGVPIYPVLIDGAPKLTHFEEEPLHLAKELKKLGYFAVEFIPHRNNLSVLKKYVNCLKGKGFIITVGTEHNTTENFSLKPVTKDSDKFDESLMETFWEGCCIITAHQYLKSIGEEGFVDEQGNRTVKSRKELKEIGETKIAYYLKGGENK